MGDGLLRIPRTENAERRKPSIEDAIILAAEAHRGQIDKAGLPLILHPLRIMCAFLECEDDEARMAAVLHDIVEETPVTVRDLLCCGYPGAVLDAVEVLTRKEGETYETYILRVAENPLAARVKALDLDDNLHPRRVAAAKLSSGMQQRYRSALRCLAERCLEDLLGLKEVKPRGAS